MGRDITVKLEKKYNFDDLGDGLERELISKESDKVYTYLGEFDIGRSSIFFNILDEVTDNQPLPKDVSVEVAASMLFYAINDYPLNEEHRKEYSVTKGAQGIWYPIEVREINSTIEGQTGFYKQYNGEFIAIPSKDNLYFQPLASRARSINTKQLKRAHADYVRCEHDEYPSILGIIACMEAIERADVEVRMVYWYDQ